MTSAIHCLAGKYMHKTFTFDNSANRKICETFYYVHPNVLQNRTLFKCGSAYTHFALWKRDLKGNWRSCKNGTNKDTVSVQWHVRERAKDTRTNPLRYRLLLKRELFYLLIPRRSPRRNKQTNVVKNAKIMGVDFRFHKEETRNEAVMLSFVGAPEKNAVKLVCYLYTSYACYCKHRHIVENSPSIH
eukprot:XP_002257504.1 hypothetical protein PKH_010090 [Plasmodium knowlesi strain H]